MPFLPEVNFDDLHSSIAADLDLYDFAASDHSSSISTHIRTKPPTSNGIRAFQGGVTERKELAETRISRSNSLQRRQLDLAQKPTMPASRNPALVAANTSAARARRQSHFPSSTTSNSLPRAPRKSIGPGVLTQSATEYNFLRRDSFTPPATQFKIPILPISMQDSTPNFSLVSKSPAPSSEDVSFTSSRAGRPQPSQSSRKSGVEFLSPAHDSTDHSMESSRSPLRYSTVGTPNSSASNKRLSMMPGHATGLGARTISPTDARRIKRMSMMTIAPPMPQASPASAAEPNDIEAKLVWNTTPQLSRKLDTPSSNRTTPDPNRKSITSIVSAASTTSLTSARGSGLTTTRSNSGPSTSRLPTLKGRNEAPSTDPSEYVPPVPAIPKAYESPKNEQDMPFLLPGRKPSIQFDGSRSTSVSTNDFTSAASTYSSDKETPKPVREERKPVKMALFPSSEQDSRASGAQDGRRTLQPIRLPPLNLRRNRTPTNDKVSALAAQRSLEGHPPSTPPAKKNAPKLPSTPMTASRANFFTRYPSREDHNTLPLNLRSSSSHHNLTSNGHFRLPSLSSRLPDAINFKPPRKPVSPFTSASLPKSQNDYESIKIVAGDRNHVNSITEPTLRKPTGPRAQITKPTKAESADASGAFTDTESNSFGSTLRRKLSMTRRRSSSKNEGERPPQPPDHEMMPPPRLPASATWNNMNQHSASPTTKTSYLHSRRKSAYIDSSSKEDKASGILGVDKLKDFSSATPSNVFPNSSSMRAISSSIPSAPRMYSMGNIRQLNRLQALDVTMDRDDMIAEEEMKKLASKRKRTEIEARELDELRSRAVPRDSVTPAQALRAARLNLFERGEIVDYKEIYFCGTQSAQKLEGNAEAAGTNFGYDDERGDYNIVLGDHLTYRYEVVDLLGKGSFGQVVRCVDHKTGGLVAIKIIRNKKRFHQQALVEVSILQKLKEWVSRMAFL